jgi:ATP-dependent DNA helicase DinG
MSRALELLGPDGPLAAALERYEARPGQLAMARGVERALASDRIFLCEAGTGTGKTLAYLLPALLSGRRVVISTATRALQEQIVAKDLPLLAGALGVDPRATLVKGLGNYLCLRRYDEFRRSLEVDAPHRSAALAALDAFRETSQSGDLGDLASLEEGDPVRLSVQSSSETRRGAECHHYDACFVTRMRREAEGARIIVVNHHLFFADLALRGPHPGRVLPDYDAVIFDEAHQIEDVATTFFGVRVSESRFEHLLGDLERSAAGPPGLGGQSGPGVIAIARQTQETAAKLFQCLRSAAKVGDGRVRMDAEVWAGETLALYHRLDGHLEGLGAAASALSGTLASGQDSGSARQGAARSDGLYLAARRVQTLRDDLATIVEGSPGRITWAELGTRAAALTSSPVDVSTILRERIFESIPSVVLTSATLASGKSTSAEAFSYVRARLGLDRGRAAEATEELVVESPFDYGEKALLYLPKDLPEPTDAGFTERAIERTADLVRLTDGGCFVLSTSIRGMKALHRGLGQRLRGRLLLVQGQASKASLIADFRTDRRAVLVATMSFWQGVDVPGDALRLVVIDRIPFPVPSDPLFQARGEALEAQGGSPFKELAVPIARMTLKQGFGRLIRSEGDDGVVALLDGRVHRKGYGRLVLSGLPPAAQTTDIEEVRRFWERRGPGAIR